MKHPNDFMVRASVAWAVGEGSCRTDDDVHLDVAADATDMKEVAATRADRWLMVSMMGDGWNSLRGVECKSLRQQRPTVDLTVSVQEGQDGCW